MRELQGLISTSHKMNESMFARRRSSCVVAKVVNPAPSTVVGTKRNCECSKISEEILRLLFVVELNFEHRRHAEEACTKFVSFRIDKGRAIFGDEHGVDFFPISQVG
jgi:hypothetical protein